MKHCITTWSLALFLMFSSGVDAAPNTSTHKDPATLTVETSVSSSVVVITIKDHRKIGKITLVINDAKGRSIYYEKGKALTDEFVRNMDKGLFPTGEVTLTVTSRGLTTTRTFEVK